MATNNAINLAQNGFVAYLSGTVADVTGDGTVYTVICDSALSNEDSCYNTGTGIYTIKQHGNYQFNFTCAFGPIAVGHTTAEISIWHNAAQWHSYYIQPNNVGSGGYCILQASALLHCTVADQIKFTLGVFGAAKTVGVYAPDNYWTYVSGFKTLSV